MSTFITKLDSAGSGPRVAVKDIIDVEGVPTTAGSRAVERSARPATEDAACLLGTRKAVARIVGKANLHELAMLPFGTNPWFGTPVNPLDPALIPGGSSSGSAVAVATDEADVALGSDTGGSVRIPAACCGVTGLKTTHGRVSLEGVWPLAPSLDTIGPLARDVAGVTLGMQLLEPGFAPASPPARTIGRIRPDASRHRDHAPHRAVQPGRHAGAGAPGADRRRAPAREPSAGRPPRRRGAPRRDGPGGRSSGGLSLLSPAARGR